MDQSALTILMVVVFVVVAALGFQHIQKLKRQLQQSHDRSNRLGQAQEELNTSLSASQEQSDKLHKERKEIQKRCEELQQECKRLRDDPPLPEDNKLVDQLSRIAKRILQTVDRHGFSATEATIPLDDLARIAATSVIKPERPRLVQVTSDWTSDDEEMVVAVTVVLRATYRPPVIPHGLYRAKSRVIVQHAGRLESLSENDYKEKDYEPDYDRLREREVPDGADAHGSPKRGRPVPTRAELQAQLDVARTRLAEAIDGLAKQEKFTATLDKLDRDLGNSLNTEKVWKRRVEMRRAEFEALKEFVEEVGAR